ncbi:PLP-dependent aminotransferase family protein [Hymenobacter sp. BT664]|uniref:PLP-dependent aminotransferase family protein n=1 Tax=Hymenobacter montanus TaxID=2771359 RepID=A0A927GJV5_9BACT|nr:PLP-dependent aminotransferase family protein [Hymenobacter montanus]MBD2768506.1 PLP-dependent aminotransferase family protein [Hymenobacter montanus]
MLPYQTLISLERSLPASLNQQITAAFIGLILRGILPAKTKLPGTRTLATLLAVHRQTVVGAFNELEAQGWIEQVPAKGTFVSPRIPEMQVQPWPAQAPAPAVARAGFTYPRLPAVSRPRGLAPLILDGGTPDPRLAPLTALARKYRTVFRRTSNRHLFGYTIPIGNAALRQQLANYLHDTRGIAAQPDNVFIARGSVMAMYLVAQLLVQPGDTVVVGNRSYPEANRLFEYRGAHLQRVSVDEQGLRVDEVEALCQRQAVRLVYITPHHHYPTTVTLPAERRVRLLQLAERHNFIILEDDYDFDFHYANSPILPLASADRTGRVLYVGSLSKALAPSIRVGYLVGPADLVAEMGNLRFLVDHQGDSILEQCIAELFAEGDMSAHLKRARNHYQQRRDVFCHQLRAHVSEWFSFEEPTGGLAVWGQFSEAVDVPRLSAECHRAGLGIGDGHRYQLETEAQASHLRLGFAALTPDELLQSASILARALRAQPSKGQIA